jgi:vanillate O-demethylase ferredoxin subunit
MIEVVVTRRHDEAEGIRSFELAAADCSALAAFEPGAHVEVHLPRGLVRAYSLCPEPAQAGRYLIAVLREPASRGGSAAMHALQAGDRLQIGTPRNLFALVPAAGQSLLFAGGIGITPLLAMAEHLQRRGEPWRLHYCARSASRMAFAERIRGGALAEHSQLHFDDGGPEQKLDLDRDLGPQRPGVHVYVCGPAGFMDFVLSGASARGWPDEQLHREYFSAPVPADAAGDTPFEVQIGRSGITCTVPAGRSVVDVLAERGIEIPVSCEQGVCGTCVTRVLDGVPDHRDAFLTDAEHAANHCFTPCCSRARSARLMLDL